MKPKFQMPFMCHQKWRAGTRDDHSPNPNSIDLWRASGGEAGKPVFASAGGTVVEAFDTNSEKLPYGSVVTIDHGDGWKTQYVHLDDQLSVSKNQIVVRGQKIGLVGDIPNIATHLHYVQIKDDIGVRVTFNGVNIGVHAGARKSDGTYPQENLTSANCPTGISVKPGPGGSSVTCKKGAGVRATLTCFNLHLKKEIVRRGPWVGAKATSTVKCHAGQEPSDPDFEIS
jgi:hypothetical protein